MPAPQAMVANRVGAPQPRQRLLPLGLLALAAAGTGRLGLLCFTPSVPERLAGRCAGGASAAQGKPGRVTLHEAMDYQSARVLSVSHEARRGKTQDASPKQRLLLALLAGQGRAAEVQKLVVELQAEGRGAGVATPLFNGTWHLLSSGLLDSNIPVPQLVFYTGGNFLHEGSIQNGGLFKAILQREAAHLKLGVPQVTFTGHKMEVSAAVEVAPGSEKTLSYSAQFKPLSPTTFQRILTTLDLPEPAGSLTPLMEAQDIIEVIYSDDDMLVLSDESGLIEILVQKSAEALVLRSKCGDVVGVSDRDLFLESPVLAMSH